MVKHTVEILRCEHPSIFKACLAIFPKGKNFHDKIRTYNQWGSAIYVLKSLYYIYLIISPLI